MIDLRLQISALRKSVAALLSLLFRLRPDQQSALVGMPDLMSEELSKVSESSCGICAYQYFVMARSVLAAALRILHDDAHFRLEIHHEALHS